MNFKTKLYITFIIISAFIFSIFLYNNYLTSIPLKDFLFFLAMLFITNNLSTYFYSNDITKNIHFPIILPVIILYGPFWTAIILTLGSIKIKYRENQGFIWYKFLFNRAMLFIMGASSALIYNYVINLNVFTNKLFPIFSAFIVNMLLNILIMITLFYFIKNKLEIDDFKITSKTALFSYFLALLIYYSYIYLGKFSIILIIIFIYLSMDFFYSTMREIETQKKLQEKQEELKYTKLKNNFFRNLSHELKTPLNLIFSSLQMMEMYNGDNEKMDEYINITKQNSYRLMRIINNLLDLNKIENDSFNLNIENIDIIELCRNLKNSIKCHAKSENKILEFKSYTDSKIISCDSYKIERALLNLLSNALKFTDENDKISIIIEKEENYVDIIIKDTGIGIKEEKKDIIFEEFGQIDDSLSRNHEGTGLGLSISKSIIELHDGKIEMKSKYKKGTEFKIKLPDKYLNDEEVVNNYHNEINLIKLELSDIT
ncbi:MAG: sensor histidine kinase [Bacillota bacterium]